MPQLPDLSAKLRLDTTGFDRSLKGVRSGLDGLSGGLRSAGANMAKFGSALTLGVTAPLAIMGKKAFDAAADLNESLSKVQTIFGNSSRTIEKWAKTTASSFGISERAALDAAGTFGNMFTQLGISSRIAGEMSVSLTELAADFASFHNADTAQVIEAITSAFRGEYDAVQRFVPTINAAAVEQKAMEMGLAATTKELTAQDKALAAHQLLVEGAGAAVGDFARTAGSAANKQRILRAQFDDASASLGNALIPIGTKFLELLQKLVAWYNNLSPTVQKAILLTAGLAAAVGPLTTLIGGLTAAIGFLLTPAGLVIGLIAALAAGLVIAYFKVAEFREVVHAMARVVSDTVRPIVEALVQVFNDKVRPALEDAGRVIAEKLRPALADLAAKFRENEPQIRVFVDGLVRFFTILADHVIPVVARFVGQGLVNLINAIGFAVDVISSIVRTIDALVGAFNRGVDAAQRFANAVRSLPGAGAVSNVVSAIGSKIPRFDAGGIVPGAVGSPQLVLAHGGETILPTHKPGVESMSTAALEAILMALRGDVGQLQGEIRRQTEWQTRLVRTG